MSCCLHDTCKDKVSGSSTFLFWCFVLMACCAGFMALAK